MSNKTINKLNPSSIIDIRKKIDSEITKSWSIIKHENLMSKKARNAGLGSGCDLKSLYNRITQLQERRIKIKGMLQALNMGVTTFDYEEFKKTNNYAIFAACEAKEAIAHWKMVMQKATINPTEKSKKGLDGTGKSEIFTSAKITSLLKKLQLEANKYDAKLEKFNSSTEIAIDDCIEDFKEYLTI